MTGPDQTPFNLTHPFDENEGGAPPGYRHLDTFDFLRIQILAWVFIEQLKGSQKPIEQLLRDGHAEWQSVGDLVRYPSDIDSPDAALEECYNVLDIAVALYSDGHWIEVDNGCAALPVTRQAALQRTWWGFCEVCRVTHMVAGLDTDGSYPGSVPVPVLATEAFLLSLHSEEGSS